MQRLLLLLFALLSVAVAQPADSLAVRRDSVAVAPFDAPVFWLHAGVGSFTKAERAAAIEGRIQTVAHEPDFDPSLIQAVEQEGQIDVMYRDRVLVSVWAGDVAHTGQTLRQAAEWRKQRIATAITQRQAERSVGRIAIEVGLTVLVLAFGLGIVWLINRIHRMVKRRVSSIERRWFRPLTINQYQVLSAQQEQRIILFGVSVVRYVLIVLMIYFMMPVIFSIFPYTEKYSMLFISLFTDPLRDIGKGLVRFAPNAVTILVIIVVTRYFVRLLKYFTKEIEEEKLNISGFHADWARPTFNILRALVYGFMIISIYPYLPGSDSAVFQGVSVFIGLIFSLGSSSYIANIVAGLVITYMRPFRIGDRVRIGDITGDVIEKTMLVTRIQTIKNEVITVPNAGVLTGQTINYSTQAQTTGLILNTTVTIGYDAPWRQVQQLLTEAARRTEGIESEPAPFVLQTSLDDFYVSYQLNAYTRQPNRMAVIYSALHANIQDAFNEAGVEIMSPHYRAARDGNQTTIPPSYLPADYTAPVFRVQKEA